MTQIVSRMFAQASPEGQAVCTAIAALFAVGFLSVLFHAAVMLREHLILRSVRGQPKQLSGLGEMDPDRLFLRLKLTGRQQNSIVGRCFEQVLSLRQQAEAALYAVGSLLDAQRGNRNLLSQYLATIFMLLGLAGTVLGLGGALFHLVPTVEPADFSRSEVKGVVKGLTGTLGQMQTVFAATLAGLIASIVLGAVNTAYHWWEERVITGIGDYFRGVAAPALLTPQGDEALTAVGLIAESVNEATQSSIGLQKSSEGTAQILVSVSEQWSTSTASFSTQLQQLGAHLQNLEARQDELLKAETQVRDLLTRIDERETNVQGLLDQLGGALLTAAKATAEASSNIGAGHEELGKVLHGATTALETIRAESVGAFQKITTDAQSEMKTLLEAQRNDFDEAAKSLARLTDEEGQTRKRLELALVTLVERTEQGMGEALETVADQKDLAASDLAAAVDRFREAAEQIPQKMSSEIAQIMAKRALQVPPVVPRQTLQQPIPLDPLAQQPGGPQQPAAPAARGPAPPNPGHAAGGQGTTFTSPGPARAPTPRQPAPRPRGLWSRFIGKLRGGD